MKIKILLMAVLLLAGFTQIAYSGGGPMKEDLNKLVPAAQKVIDAGKQGDAATFEQVAEEAIKQVQEHPISAKQQRILAKMRSALRKGKAGKLAEGAQDAEEAMAIMKQ
ncbi:MAG: hypothetical protein ACU84H_09190 [Gammaproteobacteria bacterium]